MRKLIRITKSAFFSCSFLLCSGRSWFDLTPVSVSLEHVLPQTLSVWHKGFQSHVVVLSSLWFKAALNLN